MLFFKIYNWLKLKTLPSSVLYKNRLFIERDSKNRRIFNNFGLIFRNSKWSDYSNNNIDYSFKSNYNKALIFSLLLMLSLFYYTSLLNLIFSVWFSIESLSYFFLFSFWFFLSHVNSLFFNFYIIKNETRSTDEQFITKENVFFNIKLNALNLNFLDELNQFDIDVEDFLFNSNLDNSFWRNNHQLFSNFFLNFFFFNKNVNIRGLSLLNNSTFIDKSEQLNLNYLDNRNAFCNFSNELDDFILTKKWSVFFLHKENDLFLENFYTHNILVNNINSNFLFEESILHLFKNKLNNSKINRWLYKYSLMHRKSLKITQKLTFFKNTTDSNAYNSSFFKKNLWNSSHYSNLLKKNFEISINNGNLLRNKLLNDGLFFSQNNTNNQILNSNKFFNEKFNFFESSYTWNLKRFYVFNSLINNNFYNFFSYFNNFNNKDLTNTTLVNLISNQFASFKDKCFFFNNFNLLNICKSNKNTKNLSHTSSATSNYASKINSNSIDTSFFSKNELEDLKIISLGDDKRSILFKNLFDYSVSKKRPYFKHKKPQTRRFLKIYFKTKLINENFLKTF